MYDTLYPIILRMYFHVPIDAFNIRKYVYEIIVKINNRLVIKRVKNIDQ